MRSVPDQDTKRNNQLFAVDDEKTHKWTRLILVVVSLLLLAAGLWRDETTFVMRRAITICLECIGIG